jgi:hypothetical protein
MDVKTLRIFQNQNPRRSFADLEPFGRRFSRSHSQGAGERSA